MLSTLNLIGAGRVGQTLARLLAREGRFSVQDVLTRSPETARQAVAFIGAGRAVEQLAQMRTADVWMLAVPDGAIAAVASELATWAAPRDGRATAIHCSGALASSELAPLAQLGWPVASVHCILSFASPTDAMAQFPGTPCGLEGDAAALALLQPALQTLGAQCFTLLPRHKLLYHAAAVFATNFVPVLQGVAQDLWRAGGVPEQLLPRLQASLLANAVHNVQALGPAGALTGPAARGDVALVRRQAQAVGQWNAAAGQAYRGLSQLAAQMAGANPAFDDFDNPTHHP